MNSLGSHLFEDLSPRFFGVLVGPNARLYLDALDALEREMPSHGDAMERDEVLAIIDRVLESTAGLQPDEEDADADADTPSARVLRRLIDAKWIEEDRRTDYRHILQLEPAAQILIEALRSIVSQSVASFTGKLRLVCDTLAHLRSEHGRANLIWQELKDCLAHARAGLRELRTIRRQVEHYARRQLRTATIQETLEIIYGEFSQKITQQCYRELIHARLPERLRDAAEGLRELEQDECALQHLQQDYLRVEPDPVAATREVRRTIEDLALVLGDVEPTADRVDSGTADFARRSRARIRYIQDVGSARRRQVKAIFDHVREHLPEARLADLDARLELPAVQLADVGLVGIQSLAKRRTRGTASTQQRVATPLTEEDLEESLREMEKNIRNALRLDRANHFVDGLDLKPGEVIESAQLPVRTDDDILDVISCLVFAPAGGANFHLRTHREVNPAEPVPFDEKAGFAIERFSLEKK